LSHNFSRYFTLLCFDNSNRNCIDATTDHNGVSLPMASHIELLPVSWTPS
jgi:hypothetical protein